MEITWLGHSCFLLKDSKGRKLLTDPFDSSIGYPSINQSVDIVTVSHQHFDHNFTIELPGTPNILTKCGFFNICDVPITGIPSYHDSEKGAKRGDNIIFIIKMDDFTLCHLGDLGQELTKGDIDKIGLVDVLFVPVGGNYTINGKEASHITKAINPHIVIPMHYKTAALSFPLDGVEEFILHMKSGERIHNNTLVLNNKLEGSTIVKVLTLQS